MDCNKMGCNSPHCHCQNIVNHSGFNKPHPKPEHGGCGRPDHHGSNHSHHSHDHKSDDKCHGDMEAILVRKWDCNTPQPKGPVNHHGHLYVNLVDGNLIDPALGAGNGTYAGAFDLVSLIDYLITNP